jgi:hypothetical protein
VELRFTLVARGIASALLATVLAVMLLAHSAPTPSDHTTRTASAKASAHLCDALPQPEEAAGHYWTRASHDPAPASREAAPRTAHQRCCATPPAQIAVSGLGTVR